MGVEELKESREYNETSGNLEELKQEVLEGYDQKDIENNYPEGEQGFLKDVSFLRESLGKNFIDYFVRGGKIEGSTFEAQKISLDQLQELAEEMRELESERDLEIADNIVLTLDELKELEGLISSNSTQKELETFLEEQLKENLSSVQAFGEENLEKFGKYFEKEGAGKKLLNRIDNVFSGIIENRVGSLSEDVTRNMGTGLTLAMFELYKDMGKDVGSFFEKVNGDFNLEKIQEFLKDADKSKIQRITGFFDILNDEEIQKEISDGEENKILTNPYKFKELYLEYLRGDKEEQEVRESVLSNQENGYKFEGLSEEEQKQVEDTVKDAVEKIDPETARGLEGIFGTLGSLENMKSSMKEKIQQNSGKILGILGAVPFLKDIFNTFLDWFGLSVEQLDEKHNGESLDSGKRKAVNELLENYQEKVKESGDSGKQIEDIFKDIDTDRESKEILNNFDAESFREIIRDYDFSDLDQERVGNYSLPKSFLVEKGFIKEGEDSNFNEEKALNEFIKEYTSEFLSDKDVSENINSGKDLAYLLLNKYVDFSEKVEESDLQSYKNWEKFMKEQDFESLMQMKGKNFEKYSDSIEEVCKGVGVPSKVLLALFIKEGSQGDIESSPESSSAMGLGQITDSTRKHIISNLAENYLDSSEIPEEWQRTNAEHQIKASAVYLKHWYEQTGNRLDAIVNYHSGGGPSSEEEMQEWLDKNPAVAKHVPNNLNLSFKERYIAGVAGYYGSGLA